MSRQLQRADVVRADWRSMTGSVVIFLSLSLYIYIISLSLSLYLSICLSLSLSRHTYIYIHMYTRTGRAESGAWQVLEGFEFRASGLELGVSGLRLRT